MFIYNNRVLKAKDVLSIESIIAILKKKKVKLAPGLTEDEIRKCEKIFDIKFPPALKNLLKEVLPISKEFINWRDHSKRNVLQIKKRLDWPWEGIVFDIEENDFWVQSWGVKPDLVTERIRIAKEKYDVAPKLVPIYSHRYMPEGSEQVLSVYQTDIIFYGTTLLEYFQIELDWKPYERMDFENIKAIPFWTEIIDANN
ncbi:SMI1/KNR4 family protein [Listeria booriae]|uniref:SMI1/KNR4 family protein n=1 Tax=Listeria booriae TaxID=1552123 RepID=A0A842B491_9LIST|nr:SMI1/KNR4 family protein [Listeria booriae]MBC1797159.1 SMI1/KNR4 family protein [Listeria booriae]